MIKNIILQHYNGRPKELEKLSFENISNYAELIGADHKIIGGKPFNENLTNPCQKVHCISEEWDDYDNVLMLDPDVFIRKNLTENIFNEQGNGIHGDTQKRLKTRLIQAGRIDNNAPYWAGSIYKFNREERQRLRSVMPKNDAWMKFYNKAYHFEDEGILSELAHKCKIPIKYLDFVWNQCSFLPNPESAKMIHMRTKKFGHLNGSWENGGKRDKIENYYELLSKGIV